MGQPGSVELVLGGERRVQVVSFEQQDLSSAVVLEDGTAHFLLVADRRVIPSVSVGEEHWSFAGHGDEVGRVRPVLGRLEYDAGAVSDVGQGFVEPHPVEIPCQSGEDDGRQRWEPDLRV